MNYREKAEQEVGCTCSDTMCVAKRARFERALREAAAEAFMEGFRVTGMMTRARAEFEAQRIREGRE
jgi:hypothetical protein